MKCENIKLKQKMDETVVPNEIEIDEVMEEKLKAHSNDAKI